MFLHESVAYFPYVVALLALLPYNDSQSDLRLQYPMRQMDVATKEEIKAAMALTSKIQRISLAIILNFAYTDIAIIGVIASLKRPQINTDQLLSLLGVVLVVHVLLALLLMRNRLDASGMTIYDLDNNYLIRMKGRSYLWFLVISVTLVPALARLAIEMLLT